MMMVDENAGASGFVLEPFRKEKMCHDLDDCARVCGKSNSPWG